MGRVATVQFMGAIRGRVAGAASLALVAVLVAACSMAQTSILDADPQLPFGCRTQAGAYFLPKTFFRVRIVEAVQSNGTSLDPPFYLIDKKIDLEIRPDPALPLCLDYRGSITSNDTLIVDKTDQLLSKITSSADDKTADIAKNLIQAIFIGASGNPDFSSTLRAGGTVASYAPRFEAEFDPFDELETAKVNNGLKDFGYCLLLKYRGARIDPTSDDVQAYCDDPLHYFSRGKFWDALVLTEGVGGIARPRPGQPARHAEGIFYRPRLPYSAFLFSKKNPLAPGGWLLGGSDTAPLENISPVIRVAIDRTYFARRATTLSFERGALRDITIEKGSEAAGFATIPLQIAQSVAALPANIIQVRIQQTNNLTALANAQSRLIEANNAAAELEKKIATTNGLRGGEVAGFRSGGGNAAASRMTARAEDGMPTAAPRDTTELPGVAGGGFPMCLQQCMISGKEGPCNKFCSCMSTCRDGTEAACKATCSRSMR